jgi:hypothetical protein
VIDSPGVGEALGVGVCVRVTSSVGEGVIDSPGVGEGEFVGVGEGVGVMVKGPGAGGVVRPGVGSGEGGDSNSPSRAAVDPANRIRLKTTARASAALRSRSKVRSSVCFQGAWAALSDRGCGWTSFRGGDKPTCHADQSVDL